MSVPLKDNEFTMLVAHDITPELFKQVNGKAKEGNEVEYYAWVTAHFANKSNQHLRQILEELKLKKD